MNSNVSRRSWLKRLSVGVAGLLVAEHSVSAATKKSIAFNPDLAMVAPGDAIKITKLEIIPFTPVAPFL
jgi:galactonate dehydratase